MSGRFVRSSKYRHVFGRSTKKEQCYDNIKVSRNAWDTNLVKANPRFISVNWEASGGGAFAVIPCNEKGRLPDHLPLFRGHTAVVLDTDWSPFDDTLIASGSDDGKAFIWRVPEGFSLRTEEGEEPKDVAPIQKLTGHSRKVGHVLFNPAAANILATSSGDYSVKIWDVEASSPRLTLKHADVIQSLSWSANGSLLVTTSRDKKLRIWDVRQENAVQVHPGHAGAKNSRAVWMGEHDRVATTGFSKMSDRQLGLWDIREPKEPIGGFERLDAISGVCLPFWDDGTQCLYLAGKGDGNIRYFEYQNDKFEYLSEYKSADPQRGMAFLPKRGVNTHENEIMRAFKTVNDFYIEPISFVVPRRSEVFQDDIYPPATGLKPAVTASQWLEGQTALPPKIDLAAVYAGEEPAEVPADYKASTLGSENEAPPPIKKPSAPETSTEHGQVSSSALKGPPPSMNEQTASIKDLASKFNDEDEAEDDDSSSFEEVPKPIERPARRPDSSTPAPTSSKAGSTTMSRDIDAVLSQNESKLDGFDEASQVAAKQSTKQQIQSQQSGLAFTKAEPLAEQLPTVNTKAEPSTKGAGDRSDDKELKQSLTEIKSLLEQQAKTMTAQSDNIGRLTREVDRLRAKLGES